MHIINIKNNHSKFHPDLIKINVALRALHGPKISSPARKRFGRYTAGIQARPSD